MSLYEPKSAEQNEALHTNLDNTEPSYGAKASESAEVVLRLPDLEQIGSVQVGAVQVDTESEETAEQECQSQDVYPASLESERWDTGSASDSKFFTSTTSLPGRSRRRKIVGTISMLLLAGIAGFGLARVTAGFYDSVPECENPAPNAPEAPAWQAPQYASEKSSKESTSLGMPVDLTTPSLSLEVPGSESLAKKKPAKDTPAEFAPPALPKKAPPQVAVNSAPFSTPKATIPVGPNVTQRPVFAPANRPVAQSPATQINEADRFSPERVQAVLRNQQGSVQSINYPQAQPANAAVPMTSYPQTYPQTQVPAVAQRPNYQQHYPAPVSPYAPQTPQYPAQASSAAVPVSPYPPVTQNRTSQDWRNQNWPSQQTGVTPSTPQPTQQQVYIPNYPSTGVSAPNTTVQQPVYR